MMGGSGELHSGQYGDTIAALKARDLSSAPRPVNETWPFVGVEIHPSLFFLRLLLKRPTIFVCVVLSPGIP